MKNGIPFFDFFLFLLRSYFSENPKTILTKTLKERRKMYAQNVIEKYEKEMFGPNDEARTKAIAKWHWANDMIICS